jgi:exonuclease III
MCYNDTNFLSFPVLTFSYGGASNQHVRFNRYPGEVRAGEIVAIREHIERLVKPGEAVVMMGDFNTAPYEHHVFNGRVCELPFFQI